MKKLQGKGNPDDFYYSILQEFLLFPLTFFFYTSRGHQTQTQNTESMGTLYDNRKPAYFVKQKEPHWVTQIQDYQYLVTRS